MHYDLWPPPNGTLHFDSDRYTYDWDNALNKTNKVEKRLDNEGRAVLFSSCRAGIFSILELIGAERSWHVGISEWSSHCVIETVGRISMPMASGFNGCEVLILNHQWGFIRQTGGLFDGILIEDSCDSLVLDKESLFPTGGRFEVFSLPKILATHFGGVVVCNSITEAESLRRIRDEKSIDLAIRQFELKCSYYSHSSIIDFEYWNAAESANGLLPLPAIDEIDHAIENIRYIIELRKKRILSIRSALDLDILPSKGRFPAVVPIRYSEEIVRKLNLLRINLPIRHFDFEGTALKPQYEKCISIPIHQGISDELFVRIMGIISIG